MRGSEIVDFNFDLTREQFIAEYGASNCWLYDDYQRSITNQETADLTRRLAKRIMSPATLFPLPPQPRRPRLIAVFALLPNAVFDLTTARLVAAIDDLKNSRRSTERVRLAIFSSSDTLSWKVPPSSKEAQS